MKKKNGKIRNKVNGIENEEEEEDVMKMRKKGKTLAVQERKLAMKKGK